mgnify:CR=1 FL=1
MKVKLLALLCVLVFFGMMGWNMGEKFISFVLADTPEELAEVSLITFTIYGVLAFSHFFSSRIVNRFGSRFAVSLGILLYSPLMFAIGFSFELPVLLLMSAVLGLGGSLFWMGIQTIVAKGFEKRGAAMGTVQGLAMIGSSTAALVGGFLLFREANVFLLGASILIVVSALSLTLPKKKPVIARTSLKKQFSFFRKKDLVAMAFIGLICSLFVGVVYPVVPVIVKKLPAILGPGQKSLEVASVILALTFIGGLSSIYFGRLSDLKGRKFLFQIILAMGFISSMIIFFSNNVWMLALGVIIYAPFLWLARVPIVASVGDLFKEDQAYALAITSFGESIGVATGALISFFGVMVPAEPDLSFKMPFLFLGIIFLLSVFLVKRLSVE